MEKYTDVIRRTLDLADTCLQGLEHAKNRMREGRFEDGIIMLHDAVSGYCQMEKALIPVLANLPGNKMGPSGAALRNALDSVVSVQEKGERAKALELMHFSVVPAYQKWQAALNRLLRSCIAS